MYVCLCHAITETHIEQAVAQGAKRLKDLRHSLRVATDCGRCARCAHQCLKDSLSELTGNCSSGISTHSSYAKA